MNEEPNRSHDSRETRLQDEEMRRLAVTAQTHPPKSQQRRELLTKLLVMIQHSGRLCRPYPGQFGEQYAEIYREATQSLFLYICANIHKYDPQRSPFMRWVNFLLSQRFFNEAIPLVIGDDQTLFLPDSLEDEDADELKPLLSEQIVQYIKEDPEKLCQTNSMKTNSSINFQSLAKRRLAGEKWKEISADLGIKVPTLSAFYQQSLSKISPRIKLYLQEMNEVMP